MTDPTNRPPVHDPQDLERQLVSRQNVGDLDGMAALYEPQAVLDAGEGQTATGPRRHSQILSRTGRLRA
jgi:hypothetical protein